MIRRFDDPDGPPIFLLSIIREALVIAAPFSLQLPVDEVAGVMKLHPGKPLES